MLEPAAKGNSLLDPKGSRKLLEAVPLRAVADQGEVGQTASQKGRSRAQTDVASFAANKAAHENQLKFGAGSRPARVRQTQRPSDAVLWDKKQLVAIRGKLSADVGHSEDDRCRVAIGGPGKRQKPV